MSLKDLIARLSFFQRIAALREILHRRHPHHLPECHIEHALRGKAAQPVELAEGTLAPVEKHPRISDPVGVHQLLEVAPEIPVHRVGEVGSNRAEDGKICILLIIN